MTMAYDTKARIPATALSTTTSAPNASYTCGANAGALVVIVNWAGRTARTGGAPTYNSVELTASGHGQAGVTETSTEVWFLLSPPTGQSLTINVPNNGGLTMWVYVMSITCSTGNTCAKDASNVNNTTNSNPTVTVTAVATATMMVAAVSTGDQSFAPTARTGTSLYEEDIAAYGAGAMYYLKSGSGAQALTWTEATSDDYGAIGIAFKEVAGATNLTVQDAYCTSAVEPAGVLPQVHNLIPADAFCTSQSDAIAVTQQHNLVVQDAYCTSQTDNVVITEVPPINLVVQDAYCTTQTDAISIAVIYILVVNDAYCTTQSDSVTLGGEGQRLFPIADVTDGNWTNESGSQVNLYESLNEETPNDSDYIQSEYNPATSPVVVKLEAGVDPGSSIGHVLRYRLEKYPDGSLTLSLVVQLRQAYVNEGNLGILIAEWTDNDVGDGIELVERPLTTGQADTITDYTDLYVRMVAD